MIYYKVIIEYAANNTFQDYKVLCTYDKELADMVLEELREMSYSDIIKKYFSNKQVCIVNIYIKAYDLDGDKIYESRASQL